MTLFKSLILACYALATIGSIVTIVTKRRGLFSASVAAMLSGFVLHSASLAISIVQDGHLPLYGAQEVCSFLGWSLVVYFLIVQFRFPTQALAALVFPTATMLTLIAAIAPPIEVLPSSLADDPVLFSFHAGLMLLAYGAFFTMFMAAVLYITQEREIKGKRFGAFFHRLPSLETCDSIGFRSLATGFILLTAGIAFGMLWQYRRAGYLWTNAPIEVVAVCTWLVYFFLVHHRLTSGWRGRRAAVGAIVGFCLVVVSLTVLRFSTGFHSVSPW